MVNEFKHLSDQDLELLIHKLFQADRLITADDKSIERLWEHLESCKLCLHAFQDSLQDFVILQDIMEAESSLKKPESENSSSTETELTFRQKGFSLSNRHVSPLWSMLMPSYRDEVDNEKQILQTLKSIIWYRSHPIIRSFERDAENNVVFAYSGLASEMKWISIYLLNDNDEKLLAEKNIQQSDVIISVSAKSFVKKRDFRLAIRINGKEELENFDISSQDL